jgi:hypothetical protein
MEVMVALPTSIESPASQLQNETLKDILARDSVDRPALTLWTYVLRLHAAAGGMDQEIRGNGVMNQRLRARQKRALRSHSARGGALARV